MKKLIVILSLMVLVGLVSCDSNSTNTNNTFEETNIIKVYTRDTTSGTREAFFKGIDFSEAIEDNSSLVEGYIEIDGNGSMISSINGDAYGIGYISLSSLAESGLIGLSFEGVQPTEQNVLNETYSLKRPFMYMIRNDWTDMEREKQIVEALLAYMNTIDGKATIQNNSGILSIDSTDSLWDEEKTNYDICTQDNSSITILFGGSTSVEGIARALSEEFSSKCGNFIAEHNHTGSGDAYKRVQGDESEGANKLHIGFASRDFKDTENGETGTFGQICWDAVVVTINEDNNSLSNITADEIKKIYSGIYTSWNQLY